MIAEHTKRVHRSTGKSVAVIRRFTRSCTLQAAIARTRLHRREGERGLTFQVELLYKRGKFRLGVARGCRLGIGRALRRACAPADSWHPSQQLSVFAALLLVL